MRLSSGVLVRLARFQLARKHTPRKGRSPWHSYTLLFTRTALYPLMNFISYCAARGDGRTVMSSMVVASPPTSSDELSEKAISWLSSWLSARTEALKVSFERAEKREDLRYSQRESYFKDTLRLRKTILPRHAGDITGCCGGPTGRRYLCSSSQGTC